MSDSKIEEPGQNEKDAKEAKEATVKKVAKKKTAKKAGTVLLYNPSRRAVPVKLGKGKDFIISPGEKIQVPAKDVPEVLPVGVRKAVIK